MPGLRAPLSEEIIVESDNDSTSDHVGPTTLYKPPTGFKAATMQTSPRDRNRSFDKLASHGKKIWHITAPASVPISLIKDVSARKMAEGASILSYKNAEYGLIAESDTKHGENLLLLPSLDNNDYRLSGAHIEKSLHLQHLIKGPASPHKDGASAHGTPKTHVKMVRQQPDGLRMRYQPFGDQSSSEAEDGAPKFKLPPMVPAESSPGAEKPLEDKERASLARARTKEVKSPKKAKLTTEVSGAFALSQDPMPKKPVGRIEAESKFAKRFSPGPKPVETSEEKAERRAEKKRKREMTDDGPRQTSDQREEDSQSTKYEGKQLVANGVDQKSPEAATPLKKRKKRKSEATDNA
ncbi:MAG: hypothetical protein Q9168_001296 [Polycauliona sp. 1 TL-2023]